jgi:hypothetical protein
MPESKDESETPPPPAQSAPQPEGAPDTSLDALARSAAVMLHEQLEIGLALVEKCQAQARFGKGGNSSGLFAAARVMQVNVLTARAIVPAATGETRHRTTSVKAGRATARSPLAADMEATQAVIARRQLALVKEVEEDATRAEPKY